MRVGIVGCGQVARTHLRALARLDRVEVVGVCDVDDGRSSELARTFGVPWSCRDAAELFERVDAVHVLTPPASHKDIAVAALEAGCHVLVEKPMALHVDEADEMIAAASRHARTLGVCHNFLFDPGMLDARALLDEGRFGSIVGVELYWRASRGNPDRYLASEWLRDLPGGYLHEPAPHLVYLQQAFLGDVHVVAATATRTPGAPPPAEEYRALFAGESGLGSACVSLTSRPYRIVVRIFGTELSAEVDLMRRVLVLPGRRVGLRALALRRPRRRSHDELIDRFHASLEAGQPPPVTAEEGRSVVAVLDRLWDVLGSPAAVRA